MAAKPVAERGQAIGDLRRGGRFDLAPPAVVDKALDALGSPTDDEHKPSSDTELALGRAPRDFADWVARNVAAFRQTLEPREPLLPQHRRWRHRGGS